MPTLAGGIGLLFYFISLLCFIGLWLNLLLGGSGGISQAEAANKVMWVFGICCIVFWFLGWVARSVVFV